MTIPTRSLSNRLSDYQKVRSETISLVTALSNSLNGLGNVQPGISLIYPAEGIAEDNKAFTRIYFMSPVEIAKNSLGNEALQARLREIANSTPIRYDPKKHEQLFLDVNSQEYIAMQHRLMPMLAAAGQNFRKELLDLLELFDAFTQPSNKIPTGSTYHIRAAFAHRELIEAYRIAHNLPMQPPPTVTQETREMLVRRGVSIHGIGDRSERIELSPQGMLQSVLPANAVQLRETAQGSQYGREVQMILHVLGEAIVRKEIPNLVMDHQFREALSRVIADARPMGAGSPPLMPELLPQLPQ